VQMIIDPNDPADIARAEGVNARMVTRAIAMQGTCTGEHGIGLHKIDFLIQESGEATVDVMRTIKHALDPYNIFNPGKVLRW
jgi:D-lactate dehydrogenase (cytochrome)